MDAQVILNSYSKHNITNPDPPSYYGHLSQRA